MRENKGGFIYERGEREGKERREGE